MADRQPPTHQDLIRWSESLAGIARTGLAFTQSLYEQERFEEVLHVAGDIRAAAETGVDIDVDDYVAEWMRTVGYGRGRLRHARSPRSAPSSTTPRAASCSCSGPTRASGCTRPAGPTSATPPARWP